MYKLIALDVDGTLLDENRKITERVRESIKEAAGRGVKIIIVSGRGFKGVEGVVRDLGLHDLVVSLNGAAVNDFTGEKLIFSEHLDSEICREAIKLGEQMDITTLMFSGVDVYVEKHNKNTDIYEDNDSLKVNAVGKLSEFYRGQPVGKFLLVGEHERLEEYRKSLKKMFGKKVNVTFSMPHFLEVYSPKINKGVVLGKVAEYYGIGMDEVIAVGDGENDIPMIESAGLGIAMGNAGDDIRKRARFVAKSNSEDGVAQVIEKFILNKI